MIFLNLFIIFGRIGIFGFGGGYAMLPLIFQSVQDFGLMTAHEFSNLVALSQITPGPIAVNAATYVGFHSAGVLGAAVATFGVALPSFTCIVLMMKFIETFNESIYLKGALMGIRPATIGLIGSASILLAKAALIIPGEVVSIFPGVSLEGLDFSEFTLAGLNPIPCIIFLVTLVLVGPLKRSPIMVILIMGGVGGLLHGYM